MNRFRIAAAAIAVLACQPAFAQGLPSDRLFPGSLSATAGNLSPTEAGNVTSSTTIDQGITAWRSGSMFLVGFASLTWRNDSAGYQWNNNTAVTVGARVVKTWSFGVLQGNVGLGKIARSLTGTPTAPIAYLSYWSGWRNDQPSSGLAFPGHVWASSGIVTPLERNNWMTRASAEEGIAVFRHRGFDLVPFGAVTLARDTQRYTWNNKAIVDVGAKVQRFVAGGVIEAGLARRAESEQITHTSRAGAVAFLNVWFGWDPHRTSH